MLVFFVVAGLAAAVAPTPAELEKSAEQVSLDRDKKRLEVTAAITASSRQSGESQTATRARFSEVIKALDAIGSAATPPAKRAAANAAIKAALARAKAINDAYQKAIAGATGYAAAAQIAQNAGRKAASAYDNKVLMNAAVHGMAVASQAPTQARAHVTNLGQMPNLPHRKL